jgi:hypothetical protein
LRPERRTKTVKHIEFGAVGVALVALVVVAVVLSSLFCSIPWYMVSH